MASPPDDLNGLLQASNLKHSKNGDPVSYLIESLSIKLNFALQDPTVFAEIEVEEISALMTERLSALESKANPLNLGENDDSIF